MAEFKPQIHIQAQAIIMFDESEMRALDALIGYGVQPFLDVFYKHLGKAYLQPHEAGMRSLFDTLGVVRGALLRMDDARNVYYGKKAAVHLTAPSARQGQDDALEAAFAPVMKRDGHG